MNAVKGKADNPGQDDGTSPASGSDSSVSPVQAAGVEDAEEFALNPDDPIDRAIMRRVEERKLEQLQTDSSPEPAEAPSGFGRRKSFGKR